MSTKIELFESVLVRYSICQGRPISNFELRAWDIIAAARDAPINVERLIALMVMPRAVVLGALVSLLQCDAIGIGPGGEIFARGAAPRRSPIHREILVRSYCHCKSQEFVDAASFYKLKEIAKGKQEEDINATEEQDGPDEPQLDYFSVGRSELANRIGMREGEWLSDFSIVERSTQKLRIDVNSVQVRELIFPHRNGQGENRKHESQFDSDPKFVETTALGYHAATLLTDRSAHFKLLQDWLNSDETEYVLLTSAHIGGSDAGFRPERLIQLSALICNAAIKGTRVDILVGFSTGPLVAALRTWKNSLGHDVMTSSKISALIRVEMAGVKSDVKFLYRRCKGGATSAVVGSFNWAYGEEQPADIKIGSEISILLGHAPTIVKCLDEILGTIPRGDLSISIRKERARLSEFANTKGLIDPPNVKVWNAQISLLPALARDVERRLFVASYACDVDDFKKEYFKKQRKKFEDEQVKQLWIADSFFQREGSPSPAVEGLRERHPMHARCIVADDTVAVGSQTFLAQFGKGVSQLSLLIVDPVLANSLAEVLEQA